MLDLNEFQTRKQKIDVLLKEQGWDEDDRSKVILDVDTKASSKRIFEDYPESLTQSMKGMISKGVFGSIFFIAPPIEVQVNLLNLPREWKKW